MTGLGRGTSGEGVNAVQVIVKSYNARFLEMKVRGLSLAPEIEAKVRDEITKMLVRGTVHVSVEVPQDSGVRNLTFNRQKFEAAEAIVFSVQKEYGRYLDISKLLTYDDLFTNSREQKINQNDVLSALDQALNQVVSMRHKEGHAIYTDTEERLTQLSDMTTEIEGFSKEYVINQQSKMRQRLLELMENASIDENRLTQEIAILADRSDISEELVRIKSHIKQYRHLIQLDEPVGKRLSFLIQELGREINTVGSKCGTNGIINIVVDFKNQLEKIREQAQNIL